MFTSGFYKNAPISIQNLLISGRSFARKSLRENKRASEIYESLYVLEKDEKKVNSYRKKKLDSVLKTAVRNVPFYRSLDGVDFNKFPLLSKNDIKDNPRSFINESIKGVVVRGCTSGTTGTPLSIPQNMDSVIIEQAFISRSLQWAGFKPGDKRAWIRGDMIVPLSQKKQPFWRYSYFEDMILLSSFHMTTENLPLYLQAMVDYGVDVIQAYPSSIVTLAKYLDVKNEYYQGKLKSIMTSSESLSSDDKKLIEKRFKCTVFDWYGLFERVAAIASCEYGRYHILTDYSHVELLDAGDGKHEIVGTNFNNSLYSLIRYKTGDHVVLSDDESCPCCRVFPLIDHIEGRVGDYLIGEDGQRIHILNHIPKGVRGLIACQFVQKSLTYIQILAVVEDKLFTAEQKALLIANTKERVGKSIDVDIGIVTQLPRTKNGKVRQAVREIEGL
ncbi:phenylacetate--CoA ligase family protein [Photobacterium sagamiensis]|uniref:phenylacetate--CoA ligase family protein n=1 Tax=Photobacterium sagamiensis TaxID=2910241 RepID=UPI003D134E1A